MSASPTLVADPSATLTIPQKLDQVENILRAMLLERPAQCETAVTALVAQAHHCQYGPPGTGKTMLVNTLCQLIADAPSFRWLMTRFTTPPELFGAPSLKALEKDDEYRLNLEGKMVRSVIAFLDEMFKANSAILNALLTLMNEGLFFNGREIVEARPIIFCGTNELPRESELYALWDRVTFRMETNPLRERANKRKMLQARALRRVSPEVITPMVTWAEVVTAQEEAKKVVVPDSVFDVLLSLDAKLHNAGVEATDRRIAECVPIIQADAYRKGMVEADVENMGLLRHVMWQTVDQIPTVNKLVLELANPLDNKALQVIATLDSLAEDAKKALDEYKDNDVLRKRRGVELISQLDRVDDDLQKLIAKNAKSPRRSAMIEEAQARVAAIVETLLTEMLGVEREELESRSRRLRPTGS